MRRVSGATRKKEKAAMHRTLARGLKKNLKKKGYSLKELSDYTGLSYDLVWRIGAGRGDITMRTAQRIAKFFGQTVTGVWGV